MRFGHRITGKIERYDDKGRGVFELDSDKATVGSGTIAVPFTAIGDEVIATFMKRDHGIKIAKLESLTEKGPDRVDAPCPHAGICGGCLWQHLSYDAQVKLKLAMINKAFEDAGHDERVAEVMPAKAQFHHRNRMDYVVGWHGEIGLKEFGQWNRYIDIKTCLLLNDGVGEILQHVREWMAACDLQPWDAKFYTGDVRYVVIREGKNTNERMIIVVVKDAARVTNEHRSQLKLALSPLCTSLLLGEQSLITDVSYAQTFETLSGNAWLEETVNDIRYRIHPNSFFQTNTDMATELQNTVAGLVGSPASLLDLYCGLGFFGIYLASKNASMHVSGFEIDAEAIELAKFNATVNDVADQCEFASGPAEDLSWKDIDADCVILDPPRAGLHPKVLKTILEKKPKTIVYVSCNYHRLVEELKLFKGIYMVDSVLALDLFPHTPHVEVVTRLRLQ